jgi:hypothetical protein
MGQPQPETECVTLEVECAIAVRNFALWLVMHVADNANVLTSAKLVRLVRYLRLLHQEFHLIF